jgi:hypothetical protein
VIGNPDLTLKEVNAPQNLWCASGHRTVETWSREGPGTPACPTRFFRVSSDKNPNVNGVYCEVCLVIANARARQMKMENENGR